MRRNLLLCLLGMLCVSCGYRFGQSPLSANYRSLSVPFVAGDPDGELTAAIVRQVCATLPFNYKEEGGELLLLAKIIELDDENIGYRYSYKKKCQRTDFIKPVESRLYMLVEVALVDNCTQQALYAPVRLLATLDIDHTYNYSNWAKGTTQFSLGQLSDADAAFEAARRPLNQIMAEKIVIYLNGL